MLKLNFSPESNKKNFIEAASIYKEIWPEEGTRIVSKLLELTDLEFKKENIEVVIFEGKSRAGVFTPPMKLRASYSRDEKLAALIHELSHHLLYDNDLGFELNYENSELEGHKRINLFLYDVWVELYGVEFADKQVKIESKRAPVYQQAWDWALEFSRGERQAKFNQLNNNYSNG